MKFLKLALTLAMLWTATEIYTTAQVVKQSNSSVSKAKTSSSVEKKAEPQYYELRCRGGVTYQTDSTYHLPVPQKLDFSITEGRAVANQRMMNMLVNFIPGTERVAPTGSNLQEGQCSWLDRGFRPEEPAQLRQEIAYFGQLKQLQSKMPIDQTPAAAERYPDSKNVPEYLKDPNHYWSFFVRIVHNGGMWGGDIFEAVSSHYWKPLNINQEIRTPRSKGPAEVKKSMR
jgi:hypothetical protein